jgi:hypothetical protein
MQEELLRLGVVEGPNRLGDRQQLLDQLRTDGASGPGDENDSILKALE